MGELGGDLVGLKFIACIAYTSQALCIDATGLSRE